MASVGKICLYCAKPIASDERVACCDRCYAAHHEQCWDRNGRCSTFRCAGLPRTMVGADLSAVLTNAFQKANEEPKVCPYCAGKAYSGVIQGQRPAQYHDLPKGPGLIFLRDQSNGKRGLKKLIPKKGPLRQWWLPGAHIKTRSCGMCKRLYLWGVPMDEEFVKKAQDAAGERYCPHCSDALAPGAIGLHPRFHGGARFVSDEAPDLHKGFIGHEILDRLFHSRWDVAITCLPAQSCPTCNYTEVSGRPIYRFL